MKITGGRVIALVCSGLGALLLSVAFVNAERAKGKVQGVAPFIVRDTATDSPGTNNVTRIVTLTAEVRGTPPPVLQWKVDKGRGFEPISGATNNTLRIGNAQISDSGQYSLFASNAIGHTNTAPVPLVVIEVED